MNDLMTIPDNFDPDNAQSLYIMPSSTAPNIATAWINKDAMAVVDEKFVSVPVPAIALKDTAGNTYYAEKTFIRVYFDTMQTAEYDSDKEEYLNKSKHFTDFKEPALDWNGGDKCDWIPSKAKEKLKLEDPIAYNRIKNVKLSRHLFGVIRMENALCVNDQTSKDVEDTFFRMKLGPSNFYDIGQVIQSLLRQKKNPAQFELELGYEMQKRGKNTWFTLTYKPIMTNPVDLTADYTEDVRNLLQIVKYENDEVHRKMAELADDSSSDDDVHQEMAEVVGGSSSDFEDITDDEVPF